MYQSSEFRHEEDISNLFKIHGLHMARMISGSKSLYMRAYPDNDVIFNANIITESHGKIWHGDLDVTVDRENLEKIAQKLGEPLYILYEMDARFEHENDLTGTLMNKAKYKITNEIT
jgi:hypothetical protein